MKKLAKIVGVVVVLVVALAAVLSSSLGKIIEKGVNAVGPRVVGVPVAVEDVGFNVLSGNARIRNLTVGNPEGFNTDYAFKLGELDLAMRTGSLLSDRIVIDRIIIDGPEITYEMGLKGNNLRKLREQMEKKTEKPEAEKPREGAPAPEKAGEKSGKRVEIAELVISGGRVNFSATALGGSRVPIPLPTIRLTDIGKDQGGASPAQVVEEVLTAVVQAATGVVKDAGKIIGKGAAEAGKITAEAAAIGADAAQKGAEAAAELADKGAAAAAEAAGKGKELGGDAAQAAAKALGEGAGKVGGLLGKGSKKLLGGIEKTVEKAAGEDEK